MTSIVGGPSKAELVFNLGFFDLEGRTPIQFTLGDGRKLEGFISALKQLRNDEGKVAPKYMLQGIFEEGCYYTGCYDYARHTGWIEKGEVPF